MFDLDYDLDLEFSRSIMEFAISQPKMTRLPRNEKQPYRLNSRPQMWPSGLTLAMTLIFPWIFKVRCDLDLWAYYTHDVDQGLSWSNFQIAVSQNERVNWHWKKRVVDLPHSDRGDFRCLVSSSYFMVYESCASVNIPITSLALVNRFILLTGENISRCCHESTIPRDYSGYWLGQWERA